MKHSQTLKKKILLIWLGSIAASFLLFTVVFYVLINDLYHEKSLKEMSDGFAVLDNKIKERKQYLFKNASNLAERTDIIASLNLIDSYQSPDDYRPIIFDEEKKKIGRKFFEILDSLNVDVIAAYDGSLRLNCIVYLDEQDKIRIFYLSYRQDGSERYFLSDDEFEKYSEIENIPVYLDSAEEIVSEINSGELLYMHGSDLVIDAHAEVKDSSGKRVGVISIIDKLGYDFANNIAIYTGLDFMFSTDAKNWISSNNIPALIPSLDAKKSHYSEVPYSIRHRKLNATFNVDFVFVNNKHSSILETPAFVNALLLVFLIIVLLLIPIGVYLLNGAILDPLKRLIRGIEGVAKGEYKKLQVSSSRDELSFLAQEFNQMTGIIRLREDELKLQATALQAAADGIVVTDKNGMIEWVNPAYEKLTGYTLAEIIGKNPRFLQSGRQNQAFYKDLWETILRGETWQGELYNKRKNGEIYLEEETITPVLDKQGEITSFVAIKRDITDIRQQEKHLRRNQRMDSLGNLTGGIAHDFNNILGVILGYAELLKNSLISNEKLEHYATEIYKASDRGARLTKKLLSFSRPISSECELVNINVVVKNDLLMLEKMLTSRINFHLTLADDLYPLWLDKNELSDAMLNLCINAMHAIKDNGEIILTTSNVQLAAKDSRDLDIPAGDYVLLSLQDNGIGIDDITLQHIFEPFFSTKGDKGAGLGLSQVYGFARRSEGAVVATSVVGEGTCIKLYFPRCTNKKRILPNNTMSSIIDVRGNEMVLVVDDENALCALMEEVLKKQGYCVLVAESAERALEILKEESVDLVISDVIMPNMNGYQLATQIRASYPPIKIQMVSGYDDVDDEAKSNIFKMNILYKPVNAIVLLRQIRKLLDSDRLE